MNGYQQLADNVFRWEKRGRGSLLYPQPVALEPPFIPFPGHRVILEGPEDDGTRHTVLSKFTERIFRALQGPPPVGSRPELKEPDPHWLVEEEVEALRELRLLLPMDLTVTPESMKLFLASVSEAEFPLAVEMLGDASGVSFQMSAREADLEPLATQLEIHFPGIAHQKVDDALLRMWGLPEDETERAVVEFGLEKPFMLSLGSPGKSDPFVGLAGALSALGEDEMGGYQVIFTPLLQPWAEQAMACLTKDNGKPFFQDGADWVKAAHEKVSQPLYGVVVRLLARSWDLDRSWQIVRQLAAPLRLFASQWGNSLVPLSNDGYDGEEHGWDVYFRHSRRCGMILSLDELTGLIRFPTAALKTSRFLRLDEGTRSAAASEPSTGGVMLGMNEHIGSKQEVWLSPWERVCHIHIIGSSGKGKSTMLFNLIRQDIDNGAGFALLDPHGDLVDQVMENIPPTRWDDVILLDPGDEQFVVPFNFLSAHDDFEKTLLASDLVAIFRRLSTSWGDQMNVVLGNAIRAFLESTQGGTLADLRTFLQNPKWREHFLKTVQDPDLVNYWKLVFPQLGGNKSIGPILTRLETFLAPKPIRYMVAQHENRLDFAEMMDKGKIFLARLAHGRIGSENANLLGSLLVAKLQQTAMARQRQEASKRRPFFVYADEFHHFVCPSMAEILTSTRKYGMGFILAHQYLHQLDRDKDVATAVSNAFTRVVFQVGDSDARTLAEGFAHFPSSALQNLPRGHAICRIGQSDNDFNLSIPLPDEIDKDVAEQFRSAVIESSRDRVAIPRRAVEALLEGSAAVDNAGTVSDGKKTRPAPNASPEPDPKEPAQAATVEPESAKKTDSPPLVPVEPVVPNEESGSGKGGHQHLLMQDRIKEAAEAKGFRAVLEHPTGPGKESIDVVSFRNGQRIACEVSVTTTIDHEIGNARKCLRDNFNVIALVTGDERRRQQLEKAISDHFSPEDRAKIRCYSPDEFIAYLTALPDPEPENSPEAAKTVKGWKVKRKFTKLTPGEHAAKTKAAFDLLGQEMKLPNEQE